MKPRHRHGALLVAGVVAFIGCSSKQDPAAELQKAAVALEKPDASAAPSPAPGDGPAGVSPSQQLKGAMEDYKAGKMEDAVTRLQLLRSATALSPEQRMALQDSIAAVMAEVYALAEKGDKRAIAAVAQYERMQTGR
ncbi:MAG: hypothetical protein WCR07_11560 [Verrucomicrobiota bacterium]|jgi:hypothetical protein